MTELTYEQSEALEGKPIKFFDITNLEILEMKHGLNKAISEQPASAHERPKRKAPLILSQKQGKKTVRTLASLLNSQTATQ